MDKIAASMASGFVLFAFFFLLRFFSLFFSVFKKDPSVLVVVTSPFPHPCFSFSYVYNWSHPSDNPRAKSGAVI